MNGSGLPEHVKVYSIGELTREVKGILEEGFPSVWVAGEVSNLSRPASGHIYLTLKDADAQLRGVIWRGVAQRLQQLPAEGLEVFARGKITVYLPRGEYQLQIEELQPKGLGALELQLRKLKEKLAKLGYFAPGRKRPIPRFPRRVALVTSPSGAAVRDMLEVLGRRWPAVEVWVCPVRVQGDGAAEEVAAAIRRVNQVGAVDVIIVGRGGGSAEDLWAFNAECVAEALFQSRIPVVSAVGHEIDLTIADMVADVRALTPSEAAERVVPSRVELSTELAGKIQRMRALLLRRLEFVKSRFQEMAQRRCFRLPFESVLDRQRQIDEWSERISRAAQSRLEACRQRVAVQAGRLETLSPLNVLSRGYSLTRRESDQVVVRGLSQVQMGERVVTHLRQGRLVSRVEAIMTEDPSDAAS